MAKNKISKQNVGNAGEYYIAARLSALDFTATITLGRAERYDILALSKNGTLTKISVKSTQNEKAKDFPLSQEDEKGASKDFYYAFVKLNGFHGEPDFWIIPSKIVCPLIREADKRWLATPGKNNKQHKGSTMRILPIKVSEKQEYLYPKNWNNKVKDFYKNLDQLI